MLKNKLFFFIQALFRNNSFSIFDKLRTVLYRPFFKHMGKRTIICTGSIFKYPNEIEIGDDCYVGPGTIIVGLGGLKIGNGVLIGANSKICTTYHKHNDIHIPIFKQGIGYKPIVIGNNIWMGFDVKILHDTFIDEGCIIGTGSIITSGSKFPKNACILGMPAKIAKYRSELNL